MQVNKALLLEKLVHRERQRIPHTENSAESTGTETEVSNLAQKLQAVLFRLQRVFLRIAVAQNLNILCNYLYRLALA